MAQKTAITPTRAENYPEWYQQVIKKADLAEISPVRGCMVIKPWGYALWENIQKVLDVMFKATGHKNIYCPLFIPKSFLEKEAAHVEGFAKECAVVTHSRLQAGDDGKLHPVSPLEEPLIVRPTSEAIIGEMFSRWTQSYRDLPILINQWANVVRWEMRTRMFLRTTEFLWQEGHTAHATSQEAEQETLQMLDIYHNFVENYMAVPAIKGEKTKSERFPGAVNTYCLESMMQDKKALQMGTSHFLGQNFAKAFDIKYLAESGQQEFAWTTSWGVSTRLIGGLIMTHSDDDGLVLPPRLAPAHVVIIPVFHKSADKNDLLSFCDEIAKHLQATSYHGEAIRVEVDRDESRSSGERVWSWVKKGVPVRIEIGPRELEARNVFMARRDKAYKDKKSLSLDEFIGGIANELDEMQSNLLKRAREFQKGNTQEIKRADDFYEYFKNGGGFARAYWSEDPEQEAKLKSDLKVTVRCLPSDAASQNGKGIFTQKPARLAIFAKAY